MKAEVEEAGFTHEKTIGIQGPGWIVPQFEEQLKIDERREILLQIARMVEAEPALSPHLLAVARR